MKKYLLHSIITVSILLSALSSFSQTDSIVFNNGQYMVGEIKNMSMGVLQVETEYSDSDFKIDWELINYIKSDQIYLIQTSKKGRHNGAFATTPGDGTKVDIEDKNDGKITVNLMDIVNLRTIDQSFLSRLDLSLSLGYTLTKANNNQQFSGNVNMGYISNTVAVTLYGSLINNFSEEKVNDSITNKIETFRWDAGAGINFFIIRDWFALVKNDLLHTSEQQLNLRSVTKGGFGNYLVRNQRMYFLVAAGGAWNYENYMNTDSTQTNPRNSGEAFLGAEYKIFDIGDLKLTTSVYGYPSLTEKGRFRTDFLFDINYEFAFDMFFGVNFSLNYDSKPASGSGQYDYVLQTTIGWSL